MLQNTTRVHLLEQRTEILDTLSTIIETLLQLPTPEVYVDAQGASSAMLQQVGQRIVDLTQHSLGCSNVSLFVIDQHTRIFYPAALAGFSPEQARRCRATISGFRLADLLTDASVISRLEAQEVVRFDIDQSPLLRRLSSMLKHSMWYLIPVQIHHRLSGLLGVAFLDAGYTVTGEDLLLIEAMRKLAALLIEYERLAMERGNLLFTLQQMNTRLKDANMQLERANRTQAAIISRVSHEFRSALTSIQGFSELLGEEDFSIDEIRNFADDILFDALRLKRIVDGVE